MTDYRLRAEAGAYAIVGKAVTLEGRTVKWLRKYRRQYVVGWLLVTVAGLLWPLARASEWLNFTVAFVVVVATYFLGRAMEYTEREITIGRR